MASRKNNSGFVLLMVLLVLVVAGTILAGAARRCGEEAVLAGRAQRELQLRWGALSCKTVALPRARRILRQQQTPEKPTAVEARHSVTLGGMTFGLIVSDEQAKANVNLLAENHGQVGLGSFIRALQADERRALPVRLRPVENASAEKDKLPTRYASFDQLFAIRHPSELIGPADNEGSAIRRRLTCWGDGKINLRRAEVLVLRELLAGLLSEAHLVGLDEFRRTAPKFTVAQAFAHLQLTKKQIDALKPLVTDTSNCHSLWVIAEGKGRRWYRLYVQQTGKQGPKTPSWTFIW